MFAALTTHNLGLVLAALTETYPRHRRGREPQPQWLARLARTAGFTPTHLDGWSA